MSQRQHTLLMLKGPRFDLLHLEFFAKRLMNEE
jgi:hypothetical protein